MLSEIHAKNFVLFDDINVEFSEGMNVITGETGAGKSLFLSTIKALFGEKPSLLKGESEIEARFVSNENDEKVVFVKFTPSRSSAKVNGAMITLSQLKEMMASMLVIHSQGASNVIRDPKTHMEFVDLFDPTIEKKLKVYRTLFERYRNVQRVLKEEAELQTIEDEIKSLEKEAEKIERTLINDEEYEEMIANYKRLSNAQEIIQNVQEVLYFINGENGLEDYIKSVIRKTRELRALDESSQSFFEKAQTIEDEILELEKEVENYGMEQEIDEEKLMELEKKIAEIERLKRRYGPTLKDVENNLAQMHSQISSLDNKARTLRNAKVEIKELKDKMTPLAMEIKRLRKEAAKKLLKNAENNLHDLGMKEAKIDFIHKDTEFNEKGTDFIEFVGQINPGICSLPLSKIASGGEMSRFYLALEAALGKKLPVETVVFDEVAAGVGVRTADVVAEKLKEISKDTQLIVITHMPQIAAVADKHFKIEKTVNNGTTSSKLVELSKEERKKEIKEMFGKIPKGVKNE